MAVVLDIIAPWIIETWLEAYSAFSFPLPTVEIEHDRAICAFAAAAVALIAFALLGIRHLPKGARRAAGLSLLPAMLIAVLGVSDTRFGMEARAEAQRLGNALLHGAKPRERVQQAAAAPRQPATAVPKPAGDAPHPVQTPSAPDALAQPASQPQPLPLPPPPPVVEKPSAAQAAAQAIARVASLLARKAQPHSDIRVIPVLYATDRVADRSGAGLDYTSQRSGRLAVGRALVSVPQAGRGGVDGAAVVSQIRELPPEEVGAAARLEATSARRANGRALVYVHGLNTSFEAAVLEAVRVAEAAQFDGAVLVYSWPSAGHVVQYVYDAESASAAEPHLADFLAFVARETGVRFISIVADGLGGAAVVDVLAAQSVLEPSSEAGRATIGDLVLRAPDMDRPKFAARVREIRPLVGKLTLYAAASDRALNISRRYVGLAPRAGDVIDGGPVVIEGMETVDVTEPPFDPRARRAGTTAAFAALAQRLQGDAAPVAPELFEAVPSARGGYWRLKANP